MKITLRQIEVFAAIARLENVSRAAVKLNMSQSAASTALLELERHFDCPLFDRIGKSLRLNGSGRGLLPQAEDMLARSEDAAFMNAKIATARFYADHLLSKAPGIRDSIVEGADSVTALALEAF